ncbi:DoxX family protein [Fulvivirga sp. M361]|uniref:DoxX family protein n=1 Tax=Fulvivirga sp. M361 TaxID=2594266 RepID=UPI00117A9030|nr:DoxX family protein [Fulvivirga sp. M361]TRX48064.1 DoxX family protein [Fulvivirga sp. M361]
MYLNNVFLSQKEFNGDLTKILLRLLLGGLMAYHGISKLYSFHELLPFFPDLIGIGSHTSLMLVIFAELVCGTFVIFGILTRLTVLPICITMMIAYFLAHSNDPFQTKELSFVFLGLSMIVFITGSGSWSIDHLMFTKK